MNIQKMGNKAKKAAQKLALVSSSDKTKILDKLADEIWENREKIFKANQIDIDAGRKNNLSDALIDRLTLNQSRLEGVLADTRNIARMPDPIGEVFEEKTLENGLLLSRQRVPLGVLAIIYESRPNVTIDVVGLALKTGNCVILRGGSETINTNQAIVDIIQKTLQDSIIPVDAVQFIDSPDRNLVMEMLKQHDTIDMLIPRGAATLHRFCRENSLIPVITGGIGICHLFVDETADLESSIPVIRNAKIQRPTVCNALDTILVHKNVARQIIPQVINTLSQDGVSFKIDQNATTIADMSLPNVELAGPDDFDTEWLSLVLGIKIVDNMREAIEHIAIHGTDHSDGILSGEKNNIEQFVNQIDSAAVYVNASTRFTDGAQFGLGAEVAVSTQRLHARGPMGLQELTTYKWVVRGDYHVRK